MFIHHHNIQPLELFAFSYCERNRYSLTIGNDNNYYAKTIRRTAMQLCHASCYND